MSAAAALTPRIRTIVLCDEIVPSEIEADVYTLIGVRHELLAVTFPYDAVLSVYLLMSCPRSGRYPGQILVSDDEQDKCVRYVPFDAVFSEDYHVFPLAVELGQVRFKQSGSYTVQVRFRFSPDEAPTRGEYFFKVVPAEE
jgi:hypothetical protein